ncbi:TLC ATP/ADP transporter [Thalictrum thalictroides]|uniref:ADP,ATP carrier protein n=1 Tax=Thalictrum thalictroides TaxID=46969 RepID=A0A7J6X8A5_THATH|nr:TLC ATP/ADP transporter [Thalictrum thalictroides]
MINRIRNRIEAIVSSIVSVHPHEISALLHSSSCFFFILSAYFVVLPLRDEGAISLGLTNLPELFVGSLVLTLIAAPISTLIFSLPNLSKVKALVLIHRFFSVSLIVFFILWHYSSSGYASSRSKILVTQTPNSKEDEKAVLDQGAPTNLAGWGDHGWLYISVRIALFLWVALLNLITISSTWARVIDVMDNEVCTFSGNVLENKNFSASPTSFHIQSGSRLFGFIGAGATLGQLFGSLFAAGMAWMGPYLLLFSALLMELAARSSQGINRDISHDSEELLSLREADPDQHVQVDIRRRPAHTGSPANSTISTTKPPIWVMLDGLRLIVSSSYLLSVALFLWLGAVVSSFFYFQKVTVIALTVASPLDRRRLFAEINSFIAVFVLAGQLTVTGRILTVAGVTTAICSTPCVAFSNIVAIALRPTWIVVAVTETLRKVVTYVLTRPGRELLFTVVSTDEKYKAKVCIDVIVQRLGDATAAGLYKLLFSTLNGKASIVPLYALPVCFLWIVTAFHLGRRQSYLAKLQSTSMPQNFN